MKGFVRAGLAAGVSAVLVLGVVPPAVNASQRVAEWPMTSPEAKQAFAEAERRFGEQFLTYQQAEADRSRAKIGAADGDVKDAASLRKKAEAAYRRNPTLTNFERMVQAQSSHDQAGLAATRAKFVWPRQYKIEKRALSLVFLEVALWPYAIMMAAAGNDAPEPCENALVADTIAANGPALDTFKATSVQSVVTYDEMLAKYKALTADLFNAETTARMAYERALRAHKASPSVITKSQMAQAKITLEEAKRSRTIGVRDLKWPFTNEAKAHYNATMEEFKTELRQANDESNAHFDKFNACVCTLWDC